MFLNPDFGVKRRNDDLFQLCDKIVDSQHIYNYYTTSFCSVVKEELVDDNAKLPCFNGRVVSWVRYDIHSYLVML